MTFKEFFKREKHIVLHGQSRRFRIIKWIVILSLAFLLFKWKGALVVGYTFAALAVLGISLHFLLRWKSKGWTQSWGPYKKIPLNKE